MRGDGSVKTKKEIELGNIQEAMFNAQHQLFRAGEAEQNERLVLASLAVLAERFKPELFETFCWPFAKILED